MTFLNDCGPHLSSICPTFPSRGSPFCLSFLGSFFDLVLNCISISIYVICRSISALIFCVCFVLFCACKNLDFGWFWSSNLLKSCSHWPKPSKTKVLRGKTMIFQDILRNFEVVNSFFCEKLYDHKVAGNQKWTENETKTKRFRGHSRVEPVLDPLTGATVWGR